MTREERIRSARESVVKAAKREQRLYTNEGAFEINDEWDRWYKSYLSYKRAVAYLNKLEGGNDGR